MNDAQLLSEHARELLGAEPDWEAYEFEALRSTGADEVKVFRITGAVAPIISKGLWKGHRNWRKTMKGTTRTAYFSPQEHQEWLAKRTDKLGQ